ncbi:MAG TPA: hypothetical protein VK012_00670 [Gemmatimonadales bacterium]|nr:hypothetical protein [Gemmatimonadales bacterium]
MDRRGGAAVWVGLALVALLGAAWWYASTRPVVVVRNALALPAMVRINGGVPERIPAGGTREYPVPRNTLVSVEWEMERSTTRGGVPVGNGIGASLMLPEPSGRVSHVLRPMRGDTAFFAPLITNATGRPLTVRINDGLAGAVDCPCEVPPGAARLPVGYYRLYRNSTVAVQDSSGRRAMFRDLGPEVDPVSGAVGLRFEAGDLR